MRIELQIQQWHWDRFVSTVRRLERGLPTEHLSPRLVLSARVTLDCLNEANLNPFEHLKLTGE